MGTCIHPEYDASRSKTNKSLCRHFRRQRRNKITVWLCLPLLNRLNQITPRQSKENRNIDTTSERNPKAQTKVRAQKTFASLADWRATDRSSSTPKNLRTQSVPARRTGKKSKIHCLAVAYIYEQDTRSVRDCLGAQKVCVLRRWCARALCGHAVCDK